MFSFLKKLNNSQKFSNLFNSPLTQEITKSSAPKAKFATLTVGTLFDNQEEKKIIKETLAKRSIDDLISQRISLDQTSPTEDIEREKMILAYKLNGDEVDVNRLMMEKYQKIYGKNFDRIMNTKFYLQNDSLRTGTIEEPMVFSYQNRLDSYQFKDHIDDYEVLDRRDEAKAITRIPSVMYDDGYVKSKFKYIVDGDEDHYQRHVDPFIQEVIHNSFFKLEF